MKIIPSFITKQLYTRGSLKLTQNGFCFEIKNRLSDSTLIDIISFKVNEKLIPLKSVQLTIDSEIILPKAIDKQNALQFPLGKKIVVNVSQSLPDAEQYELSITINTLPFGKIEIKVSDSISPENPVHQLIRIPRIDNENYDKAIIAERWNFVENHSGHSYDHIKKASFDPSLTRGNIENYSGVVQLPLGLAGPLIVHGTDFSDSVIIPLATTEGTLVASYDRGIKLINLSGGAHCVVTDQGMQRAPMFECKGVREAVHLTNWLQGKFTSLKKESESTSSVAKLISIEPYQTNKFVFCRFNYTTGDASGQNMVTKATLAACNWILQQYPGIQHFYLESNMAPEKKSSYINVLRTRGRKVTAEAIIKRAHLVREMRVEPEQLIHHLNTSSLSVPIAGLTNNALHSVNGITAVFIATGQDVATIVESASAIAYSALTPEGDLYASITLPSLVVATYGGGTGLPTQKECLTIMGCYGAGKANRFAEIIAGVVMAGELSLAAAISSLDWVASHEHLGRNK